MINCIRQTKSESKIYIRQESCHYFVDKFPASTGPQTYQPRSKINISKIKQKAEEGG